VGLLLSPLESSTHMCSTPFRLDRIRYIGRPDHDSLGRRANHSETASDTLPRRPTGEILMTVTSATTVLQVRDERLRTLTECTRVSHPLRHKCDGICSVDSQVIIMSDTIHSRAVGVCIAMNNH
jgi:hypothetical protein